MTDSNIQPPKSTYVGLFLVAMATLMFEILLTRIFSVTTWYHFAFMAISVAMFGMTAGAIAVYLKPEKYSASNALRQMGRSSLIFAWTIPAALLGHLCIPFDDRATVLGVFSLALTYAVVAVPFFYSGIAICLALTRFPRHVSKLYAADLAGAGVGCIVLLGALRAFGDGPSAVLAVAVLAVTGALLISMAARRYGQVTLCALSLLLLGGGTYFQWDLASQGKHPIRVSWVKGGREAPPAYERWNSFSRITVVLEDSKPWGWGLSDKVDTSVEVPKIGLRIDGAAGTPITRFDGNIAKHEYLKYDVTNLAHFLRDDAKVLVVGAGGGRDVLSALVFDQREVVAVEMNEAILHTVNEHFGDYSGHLDKHPKVRFVHDEARSFISRTDEKFDLLQISLIDTWAATAAGAFVLAENALYTTEAWRIFLEHLSDGGLLTTSRWYRPPQPAEVWRMTSLAAAALRERGVENPHEHIAVVCSSKTTNGIGNLIVGKNPLSAQDIARLRTESGRLGFTVLLADGTSEDTVISALSRGEIVEEIPPHGLRLDLAPPTDDRPFFFNVIRLRDVWEGKVHEHKLAFDFNLKAVQILLVILCVVTVLTLLCIVMPLVLTTNKRDLRGAAPLFLFFASIGLGFLLVELSQMHRLILLLGHPTYGLSVVLFALLLSSGLGSFLSQRITDVRAKGPLALLAALAVLGAFGLATPPAAEYVQSWSTPLRIAVAVLSLFPLGLVLGMAFPLGLRLASGRSPNLLPWLWGINGAMSVLASVLSTGIALTFSISTAYWTGACCYVVALLAFLWARVRARELETGSDVVDIPVDTDADRAAVSAPTS